MVYHRREHRSEAEGGGGRGLDALLMALSRFILLYAEPNVIQTHSSSVYSRVSGPWRKMEV